MRKVLSLLAACAMAMSLSSCGHESLEEVNCLILKEKYGKEFKIKECFGPKDCIAYPVDDPGLIFYSGYTTHESGYDGYECALAGRELKKAAEEKLKKIGFTYRYYLDLSVGEITDPSWMEKRQKNNKPEKYKNYISTYTWFISCDIFELSDKEIYDYATEIVSMDNDYKGCFVRLFFVTDEEYKATLEHYSNYTDFNPWGINDFYNLIEKDFVAGTSRGMREIFVEKPYEQKEGKFIKIENYNEDYYPPFEEFEKMMQEVRSNELYR